MVVNARDTKVIHGGVKARVCVVVFLKVENVCSRERKKELGIVERTCDQNVLVVWYGEKERK